MANEFPEIWFDTFLTPTNAAPVHRELAFIQAHLPISRYTRLLDVPCGIGRHAGPLSELGYEVVGVDRSKSALDIGRRRFPGVDFHELDMRAIGAVGKGRFDGLLCLWQSFGFGDATENRTLLAELGDTLRPGGRLLMDIYNAEAARRLPDVSSEELGGRTVTTKRAISGRRLRVEISYSDWNDLDVHDWEIYSPADFEDLARRSGMDVILECAWFDAAIAPSEDYLRMQFLLEKTA